jgi:hypothetical protein
MFSHRRYNSHCKIISDGESSFNCNVIWNQIKGIGTRQSHLYPVSVSKGYKLSLLRLHHKLHPLSFLKSIWPEYTTSSEDI